ERREDVPELIDYFLTQAAERLGRPACELTDDAQSLLAEYEWPGNVRELENLMTRVSVLAAGKLIDAEQLGRWLSCGPEKSQEPEPMQTSVPVGLSLHETERRLIEATLEQFGGHRAKTAEALGIGLRTLSAKLKQYGYAPRAKTFRKAG
ncbi:MAG: sigma-54-dependent Fis family transcriptional regulator, partial [Pirellulales bacterium]|nr:sigma-54-dependent Fis family transcriptional regulator [Pirellulales bacterium]